MIKVLWVEQAGVWVGVRGLPGGGGGGGMVISVNMLCKNIFDIVNVISFLLQCL